MVMIVALRWWWWAGYISRANQSEEDEVEGKEKGS